MIWLLGIVVEFVNPPPPPLRERVLTSSKLLFPYTYCVNRKRAALPIVFEFLLSHPREVYARTRIFTTMAYDDMSARGFHVGRHDVRGDPDLDRRERYR